MQRTLLFVILLALEVSSQDLRVTEPARTSLRLGERTTVTLSYPAKVADLTLGLLPRVEGLRLTPSEPLFDGEHTRWEIALKPLQAGSFTVPAFAVTVNGREVRSGSVTVSATSESRLTRVASLEVSTERTFVYRGESLLVSLRFCLERGFLEENLVALFRQPLALPVLVEAFFGRDDLTLVELPGADVTVALNGGRARARRGETFRRDEREFVPFQLGFRLTPSAGDATKIELPPPWVQLAHASNFEDDFINGRTPLDRTLDFVYGNALSLDIRSMPEADGVDPNTLPIGTFVARATLDAAELPEASAPFFVTLTVEGKGTFDRIPIPTLGTDSGFHVRGVTREETPSSLRFRLEVIRTDVAMRALPPFSFESFDPITGQFEHVLSESVPLVGAPPSAESPLPAAGQGPWRRDQFPTDVPTRLSLATLLLGLCFPLLLCAGLTWWLKARERDRMNPERVRAREAMARFEAAFDTPPVDLSASFAEYLSARLLCPPAAVKGADVRDRLHDAGIDAALASRTQELLSRLVTMGYGRVGQELSQDEVKDLARELEVAFSVRSPSR